MTATECVNMYKIMHLHRLGTLTSSSSLRKTNKQTNQQKSKTKEHKPKPTKNHGMPRGSKTKKKQCKLYVIVKQLSI